MKILKYTKLFFQDKLPLAHRHSNTVLVTFFMFSGNENVFI